MVSSFMVINEELAHLPEGSTVSSISASYVLGFQASCTEICWVHSFYHFED